MVEAVFVFGALNVLFEFVLLCMLQPRTRLRLLGNDHAKALVHVLMLSLNLVIHWGTLVGTMSAIVAFVCSLVTVEVAAKVFGCIRQGRYYTVGLVRYSKEELV